MILELQRALSGVLLPEVPRMYDFLLGLAFVLMVLGPAIMASIHGAKFHDHEG